jgi:hypothetical protein
MASYSLWFAVGGLLPVIVLQRLGKTDPTNWRLPVYTQWVMIALMFVRLIGFFEVHSQFSNPASSSADHLLYPTRVSYLVLQRWSA